MEVFSADKILQIIGYLLSLNDKKMNLLKLMKELYLIDRLSIEKTNFSLSGDEYFSLNHGPVLSATKNLLEDLGRDSRNYWDNFLTKKESKYYPNIILINNTKQELLSDKDKEYIETISNKFKDYNEWEVEDYTHKLKEWKDPQGSSKKIRYRDIMLAIGKTEEEIEKAKNEYKALSNLADIINNN